MPRTIPIAVGIVDLRVVAVIDDSDAAFGDSGGGPPTPRHEYAMHPNGTRELVVSC